MKSALTSPLLKNTLYDQQLTHEMQQAQRGVQRYQRLAREATQGGRGGSLKAAERIEALWYKDLLASIKAEQKSMLAGEAGVGRDITAPIITNIPANILASITLSIVFNRMMKLSDPTIPLSTIASAVGRAVNAQDVVQRLSTKEFAHVQRCVKDDSQYMPNLIRKSAAIYGEQHKDLNWERTTATQIGVSLIWLLIGIAVFESDTGYITAFKRISRVKNKKTRKYLVMDSIVLQLIDDGHNSRQHMSPRYEPMLVPPLKWTSHREGGYLTLRSPLVKNTKPIQKKYYNNADMSMPRRIADALGSVPMYINNPVLEVMKYVWETGGNEVGIPRLNALDIPPYPVDQPDDVIAAWKKEAHGLHKINNHERSERTKFYELMDIADRHSQHDFYCPRTCDYRYRFYSMVINLNHQDDDPRRALFKFSETLQEPVGERGFYWLQIGLASLFDIKGTEQEKLQWALDHRSTIIKAAQEPKENSWWRTADKPWQALGLIFEIAQVLKHGLGYKSSIILYKDGTCNGLQHYAALGRNSLECSYVNVAPTDYPADVYEMVCKVVREQAVIDASKGDVNAMMVLNFINRSVCKTPIMTKTYNVTMVGARDQIMAKLLLADFAREHSYAASVYLSKLVLEKFAGVCEGAEALMNWVTTCTRLVSRKKRHLVWISPIGAPIVFPYKKKKCIQVRTIVQTLHIKSEAVDIEIAGGKQNRAAPPGFIHGVDASHMGQTALTMIETKGLPFIDVHDAFGSIPAKIDDLDLVLRVEFVKLHSKNIVDDFYQQLQKQHPDIKFPDPPARGDFDINTVMQSKSIFS